MTTTDPRDSSVTTALAGLSSGTRFEAIPVSSRIAARHCLLDFVAVAIAGAREPVVRILCEQVRDDGGEPQATVFREQLRLPARSAALVNGTAAHILDYDDNNMVMQGHPSTPLLAALLALAEFKDASGAELLEAFVAGYDTQCRISAMFGRTHYEAGFHATATMGTFGAASACARLLKLDPEKTSHALAIAATQASGLKSTFGTMCKSFQVGQAAQNGLLAAMLAERGLTGPHSALERMDGFAPTHSPTFSTNEALKPARSNFHVEDTIFKYHANCFETHAVSNSIAEMKRAHGLDPSLISHIDICVDENLRGVCNIVAPTDGTEMKFSLTSAAALTLLGHDTGRLDTFTDTMADDPEFIRVRERVSVHLMKDYPQCYAEVSLTAHDGRQFKSSSSVAEPEADLGRQEERLNEKCHMLLDPIIGRARSCGLIDDMIGFDELNVRDLVRHFSAR